MSDNFDKANPIPGAAGGLVVAAPFGSPEDPSLAGDFLAQACSPGEGDAPLKIKGEQTIATTEALRQAFARSLDRGAGVVLDLSAVDHCDTAALQLIFALRQSAAQRSHRFQITALSPAVAGTAAALGLSLDAFTIGHTPAPASGDCAVAGTGDGI